MRNKKVDILAFCGVCVALNIVLGIITSAIGIPLYLDTLGTMLTAVIIGPVPAMIVGALSNIITGLIFNPTDIPFFIVNVAVGLITGLIAKKFSFTLPVAIVSGLILAAVCPAIGTPIGIAVYGGLNGSWSDVMVAALVEGGKSIFAASFLRNIASNLVDKVGTSVVTWLLVRLSPGRFLENFRPENTSK